MGDRSRDDSGSYRGNNGERIEHHDGEISMYASSGSEPRLLGFTDDAEESEGRQMISFGMKKGSHPSI